MLITLLFHSIFCHKKVFLEDADTNLKGITPFEAWNDLKSNVKHFRVFGPQAWSQIPIDKCMALDPHILSSYLWDI